MKTRKGPIQRPLLMVEQRATEVLMPIMKGREFPATDCQGTHGFYVERECKILMVDLFLTL